MKSNALLVLVLTVLAPGASAVLQEGDPLLRDAGKKAEKFDPSKVTHLTAWPKPANKEQLATDLERLVKAAIPEMAEGGRQGVLGAGAAAVPALLERYGREKDDDVLARLKSPLMDLTAADQTRLLAKEFEHRDPRHRSFALWRAAAFPDQQIRPQAEAAWARILKQGDKADPDERYSAALCTTSTGSLAAFDALFEIAQRQWAKRGGEMRTALEWVRGPEPTKTLLGKLAAERKAKIAALKMLAGCGDKSALPALKPLLDDTDNEIRVVTINALRGIVDGEAALEQLSAFEAIEMAKKWKERI